MTQVPETEGTTKMASRIPYSVAQNEQKGGQPRITIDFYKYEAEQWYAMSPFKSHIASSCSTKLTALVFTSEVFFGYTGTATLHTLLIFVAEGHKDDSRYSGD